MSGLSIKAPAKINLGLLIGSQRSDGFHDVLTIYQTVDLYDELDVETSVTKSDQLMISGNDRDVPDDSSNLVLKVIETLRDTGYDVPRLKVTLTKRIPTGAGLGGGSSDAAAILKLVNRLMPGAELTEETLSDVARRIGADVPFFLYGGTMLGKGRGGNLEDTNDLEAHALLAVPPYRSSTVEAFEAIEGDRRSLQRKNELNPASTGKVANWRQLSLRNDFDAYLAENHSFHTELKARLNEQFDQVGLSGSGSALYGLCDTKEYACEQREAFSRRFSDTEFYPVSFVSNDEMSK